MNPEQALDYLHQWNAPLHLVRHGQLVAQVAIELVDLCQIDGLVVDAQWIEVAALLHDVGKIIHTEELHQGGILHEEAGQTWLRSQQVEESLCRICVSHGQWSQMECSLEELLVALSDKLWKGKRIAELEERVVRTIADKQNQAFWTLYTRWDQRFEELAAQGDERLMQSLMRSQTLSTKFGRHPE